METVELAPTVRVELRRLYDRDGKLTASSTLAEASDPGSILHPHFEWDDSIAAHEHRLEQARSLIRSYEITVQDATVRSFVFVKSQDSYIPIDRAMARKDWREEVVAEFERDAARFEARWSNHRYAADHYRQWIRRKQ